MAKMVVITDDDFFFPMANRKDGRIFEHRLIMAKHLGRCLSDEEVVHHINGNSDDNRLDNLRLMGAGEHIKYHSSHRLPHGAKQATIPVLLTQLDKDRIINYSNRYGITPSALIRIAVFTYIKKEHDEILLLTDGNLVKTIR